MVLRGFDRDMVNLVQAEMEDKGVKFLIGKIPTKVSKLPSGKLLVEWQGDQVSNFFPVNKLKSQIFYYFFSEWTK